MFRHDGEGHRSKNDVMDHFVITRGEGFSKPSPVLSSPNQQSSNTPASQAPKEMSVRAKTTTGQGRPRPNDQFQPKCAPVPQEASDSCNFIITRGLPMASSPQSLGQEGLDQVYSRNAFGNANSYAMQTAAFCVYSVNIESVG